MFLFIARGIIVTRHVANAAGLQLGSYSTAEQATRYKWIDGRTIYARAYTGTISSAASARSAITFAVPAGLQIVDASGYFNDGGDRQYIMFSNWRNGADSSTTTSSGMFYDKTAGSVTLVTLIDTVRVSAPYTLILFYVK